MQPEYVLAKGSGQKERESSAQVHESEEAVFLSNDYDISHLKGTASMFGSYEGSRNAAISRNPVNEKDFTVTLIVDAGTGADYIKAYSAGDYSYPGGSFSIAADIASAPDFGEDISFGEYAAEAFMSRPSEGDSLPEDAPGFRVFNMFAPRYIYAPVFTVSTEGLAAGEPESFGMSADRMIIPLSGKASYDDYTIYEGGEAAGANETYAEYAREKYTRVPEDMLYYLKRFLAENGIDPDDPDKAKLMDQVLALLSGYTYTRQIEIIPAAEDPLLWFLTESREGYCQHFASAGTMLLRTCGIPARYCFGYLKRLKPGTISELTVQDAHAWTEVFDGKYWQLLETCVGIPAEGQLLPSGIRTEHQTIFLPSPAPAEKPLQSFSLPGWVLPALAIALLLFLAVRFAGLLKKHRPDALQEAEIRYRYLRKYYYINDETEALLNRICYSRDGARAEDVAALDACCARAGKLLLYRHKYLSYAVSRLNYARWVLRATLKNMGR